MLGRPGSCLDICYSGVTGGPVNHRSVSARHTMRLACVAVACASVLAACGSSTKPIRTGKVALRGASAAVKYSDCMRSHGVPKFPDLTPGGGPLGLQLARSGINLNAPAYQTASSACQKLMPAAKAAVGPTFAATKAQMVALAKCMRAHGLKTFPDPRTSTATSGPGTPPPPGTSSMSYSGPGGSVSLNIPDSLQQSPAFNHDAVACGFPGPTENKHSAATAG